MTGIWRKNMGLINWIKEKLGIKKDRVFYVVDDEIHRRTGWGRKRR